MHNTDIVRACFDAYLAQDTETADRLLGDDLVFTSPQDDHIDRATYFERCFPTTGRLASLTVLHLTEVDDTDVFVLYEYELTDHGTYRNTEVLSVRDGRVVEIQVFFGGRVT
jgi:ketosteroid isomerase-like protein